MAQDRRTLLKTAGMAMPLVMAGMGVASAAPGRATSIGIGGDEFLINGKVTYPGRTWRGKKIQGLLFTSRMVNCIINDQNPETRGMWSYRDGPWDPERNTSEFIAALPLYKSHGLTSVAFNIQGGSPMGYGWHQPWHTSGYTPEGDLLPDYRARLIRVLDGLDANGMAAVLGLFYISATPALKDEAAVIRATDQVTDLICDGGYTNVMIEVGNEADIPRWPYPIILPARAHELVMRIQARSKGKIKTKAGRLLVSTSLVGFRQPRSANVPDSALAGLIQPTTADIPQPLLQAVDYVLLHGNAMDRPEMVHARIKNVRTMPGYHGQPLLINEDDHFDFDKPENNFTAAVEEYCGWGYFDYRQIREPFQDGYQSLPVDWGINSARKKGFFNLLAEMTGSAPV